MSGLMTNSKRWWAYGAAWCAAAMFVGAAVADPGPIVYPKTKKGDVVDEYHGMKVPDPYRWLEDDNSAETAEWVEAQNKVTFGFLGEVPQREALKKRLTDLWNYERFGIPYKRGERYFYSKNDGLQNQSVLYTMKSLTGEADVLLDPNKLSADGTVALSGTAVTDDGKLMAYGLAMKGSDWKEWKVRNIETKEDLSDHIKWVKFSGAAWTKDGKGFFYSRYDEPKEGEELQQTNYYQKLYYHKLGTPQSEDILVYHRPDLKEWGFGSEVTDDGKYLIINVSKGTETKNLIFYKDISQGIEDEKANVVELIPEFESEFNFIDNDGPLFWFQTDAGAPRYRVIAIDTTKPDKANWKEVIPQQEETMQGVDIVGNRFFGDYLKDARSLVKIFDANGNYLRNVPIYTVGSVAGFGGKRQDQETFYLFTSFIDPGTIYRFDTETGNSDVFRRVEVVFNPKMYETKQVFYHSKDGTKVPMFLTYRRGLKLNGQNPTLLYGYGGFNISITPSFRAATIAWLEMGGIYAVANLRGGGEYGKDWHDAGKKQNKQNVFDDFIAAAEWLTQNKYTSPEKLAIRGGSNGGLLVGACMTQRPDLFAACLPAVGVMDMLRFHKFTIGWAWTSDYGSPDNKEEFETLMKYSPLHNLKPGTAYPATLITTADHDDRVVPAHSFKFAAALQEAQSGPAPTLIRIQTKAGHGAGKPTTMQIEEEADVYSFLVKSLHVDWDPKKAVTTEEEK